MPIDIDVSAFQSAFGRLCDLAARALHDGVDEETVRIAFLGDGDGPEFAHIRAARASVSRATAEVTGRSRFGGPDVARELIRVGRMSRDAVEQEWMVELPIVNPNP